jgi:hypothetical protein
MSHPAIPCYEEETKRQMYAFFISEKTASVFYRLYLLYNNTQLAFSYIRRNVHQRQMQPCAAATTQRHPSIQPLFDYDSA